MAVKFVNQNWTSSSHPSTYKYEDDLYDLTWNTNAFSNIPSFSSGDTIFFAKETSWDAEENVVYSDTSKTVSVSSSNVLTFDSIGKTLANITLNRIELNSGSTLTISNSAFSITDQVKMMGGTLNLVNAVVTGVMSQTAQGTISLTNSNLNITQFSTNGLKSNVTLTGSTMSVGSRPGSIKALQFKAGSAKTITLDLNSTLDVSGNIENSDENVYTINAQIGDSPELTNHTYQLLIVGGSFVGDITCTINGNDPASWSAPEGYNHRYVDLGGHGMYLTDLTADTVYIGADYANVGTVFDKGAANEKLVGINAGSTTGIVAATTSAIYLTGGNASSYGTLDLSSQEQNTTISTTGAGAAKVGTLTTASGKTVTLSDANFNPGSITNNGTLTVNPDSTLASTYSVTNPGTLTFSYKNNGAANNSNFTAASINNSNGTVIIDVSDYDPASGIVQVTGYSVSNGTLALSNKGEKTVSVLRDSGNKIWLTNTSTAVLYVNTGWTSGDPGTVIDDGIIYGVNTSASLSTALTNASPDLSICIYNKGETGYTFSGTFSTATSKTDSFTITAYDNGIGANAVTIYEFNHNGTGTATFKDMKLQAGGNSFRAKTNNSGTPTIEFSNVTYDGPGKTTEKIKVEQGSEFRIINGSVVSDVMINSLGGNVTVDGSTLNNVKIQTATNNGNTLTISGADADHSAVLDNTTLTFAKATTVEFSGYARLSGSDLTYTNTGSAVLTVLAGGNVSFVSGTSVSATSLTNNGTVNISGTSKLNIGTLSGNAIQLQSGTTLTNSSISGGAINSNYDFTFSGSNSLTDVTLTATGKTITNSGTLTVDALSTITAASVSGGTINVLTEGVEAGDHTYLVVYGTLEENVKISVNGTSISRSTIDGTEVGEGYYITTRGGKGIWLTKESQETLYVNSAYTPEETEGYGYNRFSSFTEALLAATAETTAITVESATEATDAGNVYKAFGNAEVTISGSASTIYFADGKDLCLAPAAGGVLNINSDIRTADATPATDVYGNAYFVLNHTHSNGIVNVNATVDSTSEVGLWGRTVVSSTGKLNGDWIVLFRSGYAAAANGGSVADYAVDITGSGTYADLVTGHNFFFASGKVHTNMASVNVNTFLFSQLIDISPEKTYITDNREFLETTVGDATIYKAVLDSYNSRWTIGTFDAASEDVKYHGQFDFTHGSRINVSSNASFGNMIELNLTNNSVMDVEGDLENAGTITISIGSESSVSALDVAGDVTNTGEISISASRLTVNSGEETPSTLTNNGTISVAGESTLLLNALEGNAIRLLDGSTLKNSAITGGGFSAIGAVGIFESTISSNTITVTDDTATAGSLTFTSAVNHTNTLTGVTLNAGGKTITNNGALTIDAATSITADTVSTGTNIITVSSSGVDWRTLENETGYVGFRKVIDVGTTDRTLNIGEGGNVKLAEGAPANVHLVQLDGSDDVYIGNENDSTVYVGTGYATVGNVVDGHLVGYNAFSTIEAATDVGTNGIVIKDGTYDKYNNPVFNGIETTIEGGNFTTNVGCGTVVSSNEGDTTQIGSSLERKDINFTIKSGTFTKIVYGGDRLKGTSTLHRYGDIATTIENGTFQYRVAGGMAYTLTNQNGNVKLFGDVTLNIQGGTFQDWIFGGCIAATKTDGGKATITGNVTVNIDSSANSVSLASLAVGSQGPGAIGAGTNLQLTGLGANLTVGGEIWGGSTGDYYTIGSDREYVTNITGARVLSFTGFTGDLACSKIRGFDTLTCDKTSKVGIDSDVSLSDVENWTFEYGTFTLDEDTVTSGLSGDFANSFLGDTLALKNIEAFESGSWTILENSRSGAFAGFGGETGDMTVKFYLNAGDTTGTDMTWQSGGYYAGGGYKLALDDTTNPTKMIFSIA